MTHIVVLGSTNMDLVTCVEQTPQRGETLTGREFRTIPGGKGANQAIAAARADATVSVIGAVGNDTYGAHLRSTLEPPHSRLRSSGGTPIGVDTALLEGVPAVVVTLGAAGSLYLARDAEPLAVGDPQVTAVDSTGAGDTFVGALAVALGEERPIRETLTWAAAAAALSVQRPGASASMPYRSETDARYTS